MMPDAGRGRMGGRHVLVTGAVNCAACAVFLLSSEASFVTGSALAADGGRCFH